MRSFILSLTLFATLTFPTLAHEGQHQDLSASSVTVRMQHTADSLKNVADRIDVRATIFAQSGMSVDAARPLLEEARTALAATDALIATALQTAAPEQSVIQEITARLITAHASLMSALGVLKEADVTSETGATGDAATALPEVQ